MNQISISFLLLLLVAFLLFNLLACFSSIHILTFDMPEKDSRHGWPICEAREISSLCPKCNALNFPRASIGLETSDFPKKKKRKSDDCINQYVYCPPLSYQIGCSKHSRGLTNVLKLLAAAAAGGGGGGYFALALAPRSPSRSGCALERVLERVRESLASRLPARAASCRKAREYPSG